MFTKNGAFVIAAVFLVSYGFANGYIAPASTWHAAALADEETPAVATPAKPSSEPMSSIADRVTAATAGYEDAVNSYAALKNRAALLEALDAKKQIKTKLTGTTIAHSPQVQAAYDDKDIAEAKMKAAEAIMNAAIADLSGKSS